MIPPAVEIPGAALVRRKTGLADGKGRRIVLYLLRLNRPESGTEYNGPLRTPRISQRTSRNMSSDQAQSPAPQDLPKDFESALAELEAPVVKMEDGEIGRATGSGR